MNEERVLKDVTQSEVTRWLLESAEADASEPGSMQRALEGLGLAPVVVVGLASKSAHAASGASQLQSVGAAALTKWIGVGLVTSLSLLGAAELASRVRTDAAPPPPAASASVREALSVAPPLEVAPPVVRMTTAPRAVATAPKASASAEASLPSAATFETLPARTSAAELAALGRARRSLQAGKATESLAQLNDFGRLYPSSGFGEEATVLRVEALLALGRAEEGHALGVRFLAEHSSSVYAARVRNLLNIP